MNKEQIINENVGLIYMIAKKFYNVSKEDLFQAGVLGLLKAYQNYDESYGAKFTSFAYTYIYGEMYTLANNRQIKINLLEISQSNQKYKKIPLLIDHNNKKIAPIISITPR